ncbi:cuticle collagen 145 [Biomphalaria pfeifferi]|uniref:Cuticle collagen 145 n=1 Tax=Biomphalaria pfeifferi TaxID=112525 RepID=A0AAD8BDN9_BIOPF|nr:cuticle collagen 145 [Biomphalaria pfeifferi]
MTASLCRVLYHLLTEEMTSRMDGIHKTYMADLKTNELSTKCHIKGFYLLIACLTLTFTLSFFVCYMEIAQLSTTVGQMQELVSGLSHEQTKTEVDDILTRTKRQSSKTCKKEYDEFCAKVKKGEKGQKGHTGEYGIYGYGPPGERGKDCKV